MIQYILVVLIGLAVIAIVGMKIYRIFCPKESDCHSGSCSTCSGCTPRSRLTDRSHRSQSEK